ncbi:TLC domain-containing protein 1 [Denticeps clupeoides]|uniref:TLC domain-containing protein n=1 Tax=Denticeps clupeoides TaxID=299321 RepID=A0AAY4B755_9TELE|nr:calfacilitin [Denticeps clupeoides]
MEALQLHPGPWVAAFALAFRAVHRLLQALPLPEGVERDAFRTWKWRNLSVSLVHSLLTGPWAVGCMLMRPEMMSNIYSSFTPLSYLLVCVSSGYFVQDTFDIMFMGHARGSWEFLLHHALVIWCFLYSLFRRRYVAGAVLALFVEVNSVTLHARLLLKLAGAQGSPLYAANKVANLFTYVAFRLSAQGYITWYIVQNFSWLDHAGYFLATILLMNAMILVYFYRLLRADFFRLAQNGGPRGGAKFITD